MKSVLFNTKTELSGPKTKKFTSYHSIQFSATGMQAWRYFDIGDGISIPFTGAHFESNGFTTKTQFSKTEQMKRKQPHIKLRADRTFRNLFFCETSGCSQVFEDKSLYEGHCLGSKHDTIKEKTSMDKVKKSYVSLMKVSTPNTTIDVRSEESFNMSMDIACTQHPVMDSFNIQGWALPTRSSFRYSTNQKKILYELFMQGEKKQ